MVYAVSLMDHYGAKLLPKDHDVFLNGEKITNKADACDTEKGWAQLVTYNEEKRRVDRQIVHGKVEIRPRG